MPRNDTPVLFEICGAVATITLNRGQQRNAINREMTHGLRAAVERFEGDPDLRIGILTGAGKAFCAGMDLEAFLAGEGDEILFGRNRFAGFVDADRKKPMIAAVEGPALAGGFEIALACDMIVASETAMFGVPEVKLGLFPVAGGAFRLARKVPMAKAMELCLTGDAISAEEADRLGLINRLVPEGEALRTAMELAEKIAANAPLAVTSAYHVGKAQALSGESENWAHSEALWQAIVSSEDAKEGPAAFKAKRKPSWKGR